MGWQFTNSVETFMAAGGALLATDPERHTIALTVIENALAGNGPTDTEVTYGWWADGEVVRGVVQLTPPYPLVLAVVPDGSIEDLIDALRTADVPVTAVNGAPEPAERFADGWTRGTALTATVGVQTRLYRLEQLSDPPRPVSGTAHAAGEHDVDLVIRWLAAFHAEAAVEEASMATLRQTATRRTAQGLFWLWTNDGSAVSMSGRNPAAAGIARVGPVYTPPEHRGRGYGSAVTAACTADALATGARGAVLFTDLANPTSNAIYQTIGYRPLEDRLILRFEPPTT
jgi:GNAT superfamily N-acetyltransferase